MTTPKIEALLIEMLIKYEPMRFFGPAHAAPDLQSPATLGWGGGYRDPHDRYGRGNKWGMRKTFNDYRGET